MALLLPTSGFDSKVSIRPSTRLGIELKTQPACSDSCAKEAIRTLTFTSPTWLWIKDLTLAASVTFQPMLARALRPGFPNLFDSPESNNKSSRL